MSFCWSLHFHSELTCRLSDTSRNDYAIPAALTAFMAKNKEDAKVCLDIYFIFVISISICIFVLFFLFPNFCSRLSCCDSFVSRRCLAIMDIVSARGCLARVSQKSVSTLLASPCAWSRAREGVWLAMVLPLWFCLASIFGIALLHTFLWDGGMADISTCSSHGRSWRVE